MLSHLYELNQSTTGPQAPGVLLENSGIQENTAATITPIKNVGT